MCAECALGARERNAAGVLSFSSHTLSLSLFFSGCFVFLFRRRGDVVCLLGVRREVMRRKRRRLGVEHIYFYGTRRRAPPQKKTKKNVRQGVGNLPLPLSVPCRWGSGRSVPRKGEWGGWRRSVYRLVCMGKQLGEGGRERIFLVIW